MSPQSILILLGCILALGSTGCKKGKQYPTAQAPPTIKDPPPKPMKVVADDSDDDLDDDDDDDDDDVGTVRTGGTRRSRTANLGRDSNARAMAPMVIRASRIQTINGHPKGPKASIFNAVTNNAMPNAAPCFAKAVSGGRTVSVVVRMTVGNSGAVQSAKAVSGDRDPALRKCLCDVVKRLTYPAFEGPKVTRSIPFTAVGSASR